MLFRNIIGQKSVKQQLLRSLNAGRLPHAQLLLGPPGSGKLALALAYAQRALCDVTLAYSIDDGQSFAPLPLASGSSTAAASGS